MAHASTIRPGELTAAEIASAQAVPEGTPAQVAAAVTREAFTQMGKGGPRALWAAIVLLASAFLWHIQGDGTVREEARSTKVLVTWLVRCEMARQSDEPPPPFPYEEL